MVSTRPSTSKSSTPFSNPLVTAPNAPITIGIIVTFLFHSFFNSLARSRYLSFFHILSILFCGQPRHQIPYFFGCFTPAKSTFLHILFFCWLLFGLVFWRLLGDPCVCQSYYYYYYYYYYYQTLLRVFFPPTAANDLPLDFGWTQVISNLQDFLGIRAVLNNDVVWMVSTRTPISMSSSSFNNSLVTVKKAPFTIGIIVTFMIHSFFNSLARSRYLSFFSHSFSFIMWSAETPKSTIFRLFHTSVS